MKKYGLARAIGIVVLPVSLRLLACGGDSGGSVDQNEAGNDAGQSAGAGAGGDAGSSGDAGGGGDASVDAGSASAPPSELGAISGSRLKQTWLRGGGAALPLHIVDAELDAPCTFEIASDGSERCLPGNATVVFSDSGCETALLPIYPSSECEDAVARFGRVTAPGDDCGGDRVRIFEAGDAADAPDELYEMRNGECVSRTLEDGVEYVSASEADPSAFVSAERVVDERSELIGVRWLNSADGGWFPDGVVNLSSGQECEVVDLTEGEQAVSYCVSNPALAYEGGPYGYADTSCESLAAQVNDSCVTPEVVLLTVQDDDGCFEHSVHEPGDDLTTVYESTANGCTEATLELRPNTKRIAIGAPAPKPIELTPENAAGSGRLALQLYSLGEAPVAVRGRGFWDTELEAACSPVHLADGVTVCVPGPLVTIGDGSSDNTYRDADCTQRIVPGYDLTCAGNAAFRFITYQNADFCSATVRVDIYEAGESFSTETVYVNSSGDCFASNSSPNTIWVERGAEVMLEQTFVPLTEERD